MGKADRKLIGVAAAVFAALAVVLIVFGKPNNLLFWMGLFAGLYAVYATVVLILVSWPSEGIGGAIRARCASRSASSRRQGRAGR
ncbi:hypothetical protein BS329_38625 [Amycolatopsis coloradensis]|uniref:Uncharacterized protein n=1 Tax=Amycolatopsis coloradensis TaxID=76021 RepID=A0A1R0KEN4_9PSEU|nr:hypothetical protein [Amycolatopsis coloradensis]OLZ43575.1 hypothetical protein BS329_38625 [Amycolatopsis coloradensis]